MSFFNSYRQRRVGLTASESMATLDYMEEFFQGGANWTQGTYHRSDGTKCLVGAANHVRVSAIDDAKHWLRQAIAERVPGVNSIEQFNDTRRSYAEIAAVLARAKQLAAASRLPAPQPAMPVRALPAPVQPLVGEILPPVYPALPRAPVIIDVTPEPEPVRARRRSLADWRD